MHKPVLLEEAIAGLAIEKNGVYVDATFGRGGHSKEILKRLQKGRLIVIDKDPKAIATAKALFEQDERVAIYHSSFAQIKNVIDQEDMLGKVSGVLMDLGVSSPQLDEAERGFSFMNDGPLDMRMDTSQGQTAKEYLASVDVNTLTTVLREYGEERYAKKIASVILSRNEQQAINTTHELAEIIDKAMPNKHKQHKHPATRTFQALRIAINHELTDLQDVLNDVIPVLKIGGRLCCISFHSLEDRIVKRFMKNEATGEMPPPGMPLLQSQIKNTARLKLIGKAIKAGEKELTENIRARSAILRIAERTQ